MKAKPSTLDPQLARDVVASHLKRLRANTNGVVFTAQNHEVEMVELLVEFARDPEQPPAFRRHCAVDVITFARGTVKPWIHDGETINPQAEGGSGIKGASVQDEITAAKNTARLHEQLTALIGGNVHPSQWPPDVRKVSAEMVEFYENEDNTFIPKG